MTTIPSGFYSNLLTGYYGNLSSIERDELWNRFVSNYGFDPLTANTPEVQTKFAQFIKGYYAAQVQNESVIELSPDEYRSRLTLYNTYQSVLQMLGTLQNTVAVQGAALMHYGRWQEEYTKMLIRVPTLTSGAPGSIAVNTTDLTRFTFGNYRITFDELIKWGIDTALKSPTNTATFSTFISGGAQGKLDLGFQIYSPSPGQQALKISFQVPTFPIFGTLSATRELLISSTNPADTVYNTFDKMTAQATTLWKEIFDSNLTLTPFPSAVGTYAGTLTVKGVLDGATLDVIPGRYLSNLQTTGGGPAIIEANIKANDLDIKNRAEVNAGLQQYIENIRSLRDSVAKRSQALQSALGQDKESLTQHSDLISAILESIDSIMKDIFK